MDVYCKSLFCYTDNINRSRREELIVVEDKIPILIGNCIDKVIYQDFLSYNIIF